MKMAVRNAQAAWEGGLKDGKGTMRLGSGSFEGAYSFGSRFEEAGGTNPEELIGAALAGCYSMALAAGLGKAGHSPKSIATKARVHIEKVDAGFAVTRIELDTEADVPGVDDAAFQQAAEATKTGCPISKALAAVPIELRARLTRT
jgi:osmotically inducible protein OsmC